MIRLFPVLVGVVVASSAAAAHADTLVVDADAPCPGTGSDEAPWCSLDEAFGAVTPGDTIQLRESELPYPAQTWEAAPDGTAEARIVLEPAPGQAPIIAGQLLLDGRSYWTLRGLTVDARDQPGLGIEIRSSTTSARAVELLDNLVIGVDGRAIKVGLPADLPAFDIVVAGNRVIGARTAGIELFNSVDARVLGNTVEGVVCSTTPFFQQEGITLIVDNVGAEIAGNVVRDFPECGQPDELHTVGIRVRTSSDGVIHHNLVEIQAAPMARFAGGISIHEESSDFEVHHNIVRGIDGCGLCDGADFGTTTGNVWAHNTVQDVEVAVEVGEATATELFGNLLVGRVAAGAVATGGEIASAVANGYWMADGREAAWTVAGDTVELAAWQAACGCDDDAVVDDPQLLAADALTPMPGSPLADAAAGSPWVEAFVGTAPDIGALEAPLAIAAEVAEDGASVRVTVDAGHAPPLVGVAGCAGFEVRRDGEALPISECSLDHDDASGISTLALVLVEALVRDDLAEVAHLGTVTDSAAIGGAVSARLASFTFALDTTALPLPAGDSGDDGTSGGAGTSGGSGPEVGATGTSDDGDGTGSGGQVGTPDSGCGCTAPRRPRGGALWAYLLLLWRRRATPA